MAEKNLWTRLLWPALGLAFLVLTLVQARASTAGRRASTAEPPTAATTRPVPAAAAEGRVVAYPGAEVSVGTHLAGTLVSLPVLEKQSVRQAQLLAERRADDHRAELSEAKARVAESEADIKLAEFDVERARSLFEKAVGSRQALDKAERDVDTAKARRETAAAAVRRLEAVLAKTR